MLLHRRQKHVDTTCLHSCSTDVAKESNNNSSNSRKHHEDNSPAHSTKLVSASSFSSRRTKKSVAKSMKLLNHSSLPLICLSLSWMIQRVFLSSSLAIHHITLRYDDFGKKETHVKYKNAYESPSLNPSPPMATSASTSPRSLKVKKLPAPVL